MLLRPRQCRRRLPHDDEQTLVIIHYNAVYSIFPYYNIDIPITNYYNIFIPSPRNKNIHSIFLLVGSLSIPNSAFTATNSIETLIVSLNVFLYDFFFHSHGFGNSANSPKGQVLLQIKQSFEQNRRHASPVWQHDVLCL